MGRRPRDQDLTARFGARIRTRREALGLSQEAFAELAGLHRTYIGHLERGETSPTLDTIIRVARPLGTDPGDLIRGIDIA